MKWTIAIAALGLLLGCQTVMPPSEQFVPSNRDFTQRLRWLDWQEAARHMEEPHRSAFLEQFQGLKDLHITDVQTASADLQEDGKSLVTWVVMEYYLLPSLTVKKLRFRQDWSYRDGPKQSGAWRITSPFPPFP